MNRQCKQAGPFRGMLARLSLLLLVIMGVASYSTHSYAQKVAIKNNIAYDALLTPNLSLEMKMAPKWTMDLQYGANFFFYTKDAQSPQYVTKKWSHWLLQPGLRYWTCEAFNGFFLGAHLLGGQANVGQISIPFILQNKDNIMRDHRYEAFFYGGGVSDGYQWAFAPRWSLDFELGLGYARIHYDKFPCVTCGALLNQGKADYLGPTKAALSLVFFLK